jgi:hypothetical protein
MWCSFRPVGEIKLKERCTEINLFSTSMSIENQVDLFSAIVERFEEVKNKEVKFTEVKAIEVLTNNYYIGELA